MVSTQNNSEPDLEKGSVGKHTAANLAADQDTERVDYGQMMAEKPAKLQVIGENTGVVECSSPFKTPSEPLKDGDQHLKPAETIRILEPSRTTTWKINTKNKALAAGADPGVWAISHHKSNLVQNIKKSPTSKSIFSGLWKRGQDPKSQSKTSKEWQRPDQDNDLRVSFAELQRMRLRKLQCKLVKHVAHMKTTGEEPENWENDLETYSKYPFSNHSPALYFLASRSPSNVRCKLPRDPFYVTGERNIDSYVLHSLLGNATKDITEEPMPVDAPWENTTEPIGGTRNEMTAKSESAKLRKRIAIAAVAGFFLMGPMWLMVLHKTLYTSLVSTTVFVTVFGIILACSLDSPKEVMSGTAAYAAVLVVFVGVAHGYIWGGSIPSEVLPPSITVPFLQVSNHLDLSPVATYAALNLWNFSSTGEDFTDLNNLKALHTFSGTEDESWFYVLSVAVEARGARIISLMLQAMDVIKHKDYETVTHALRNMATCIRQLTQLLDRMSEKCDPMVFYHQIRPFLAGTKNMGAAGLPNGVFYDEGDGIGHWRQLRGGSNGQSSLIQFFDLVLGIDHTSTGNHKTSKESSKPAKSTPGELSFHEEVRLYMPGPHRKFLASVSKLDKIRDFVHSAPISPAQQRLCQSYQDATEAFGDFRQAHMQMVTRYIIVPSRKPAPSSSFGMNLATTSLHSDRGSVKELTGTGGTDLIPFLRTTRDDTYQAGLTVASRDISVIKPRVPVDITIKELTSIL
ncbi:hypothetical protein E0Z10_g10359 [Xylaria hypoxylon]|uniref:Indoleamine 2,3-dioxygenase n=1 Tax=Xylaria hypoxylon TaxID=37992 RepID=A0A4Z0YEV4_9PEZI|nr:hypothetical protein E0Z10_g10359 [Xylaria hypoxylon]